MKKMIVLGVFLLLVSAQSVCAQVNDVEKKQVEEQIVLVLKKYEGLGLTTEQLAEKVAADLLEKARALQDDVALDIEDNDEEKSNSKKKWIIGAIVAVAACGIGYWVYKTYFAQPSLEEAYEKLRKAAGENFPKEIMEDMDKVRKQDKENPEFAKIAAVGIAKLAATVGNKSQDEIMREVTKVHLDAGIVIEARRTGRSEASLRAEALNDPVLRKVLNL